jgi:hypothetical protein
MQLLVPHGTFGGFKMTTFFLFLGLSVILNETSLASLKASATRLGISIAAFRRLADAGYIRTIYLGGRRMVPIAELKRIETEGLPLSRKSGRASGGLASKDEASLPAAPTGLNIAAGR